MTLNVFSVLADITLALHVSFVIFVVVGLLLVYVGFFAGWNWVRNFWFRVVHLTGIGVVVLQSWLGIICPLTTFEMWLRDNAGQGTYSGSFIQYWLQTILYYDAPAWVFVLCYSLFGSLVLMSWFLVKPRRMRNQQSPA